MDRRFLIISILVLVVINVFLYAKTIGYEFVRLDDPVYVIDNPNIKEFSPAKLKKVFTEPYNYNYQPLVILSYALEYKLFKNNASGFHFTNIIFNILNSLLVFYLIYLICKCKHIALIVALFFSLHPMQAESVAWISERKGLMCAFFYLLSFISYIFYNKDEKGKLYIVSLLLFLAALLSKPMAVTFPIILILYDYLEENISKKGLIEKIPFFALSAVFSVVTFIAQKSEGAVDVKRMTFLQDIFFFVFYNIGFYISKLLIPIKLSIYYGYPKKIGIISIEIAISLLVLIALIIYAKYFKRIKREINFGIMFFLVSILPIIRFVPIGNTLANDRYMYIPMIGFFFAFTVFVSSFRSRGNAVEKALFGALVIYFSVLGTLTFFQIGTWENSYNLYTNALKHSPDYGRAHMGLGYYYTEKNDNVKARESFAKALEDETERERALFYLGVTYVYDNDPYKAREYFLELVKEYPKNKKRNNTYAYRFLGDTSAFMNRDDEAVDYYMKSLKLDPKNFQAYYGYGTVLEKRGDIKGAIEQYKKSISINDKWDLPKEALKRLGGK